MTIEIHRKGGEIETRPKSSGGKLFDLITYGGIAGVGTFFATIPVANMFKQGGRLHSFDGAIRGFFQKLGASEKLASKSTEVTHLMHGGNLMLIPVGLMEYFRTPIVQAFNRMLNDPTDPKSVEEAPPQTLMSILKARVVAWLTVFAGFALTEKVLGAERYDRMKHYSGEIWSKIRRQPIDVHNPHSAYNHGRTGAEDMLATISSATLLYVGSHAFANHAAEKRAHRGASERRRESQATAPSTTQETPVVAPSPATTETPSATISSIQREAPLVAADQQPVAAL